MADYTPRLVGTVTKYVFVESPTMTPSALALRAYEVSEGVMIKETCFGLQVTGKPEDVDRLIRTIRTFDPAHIFVKDRGFPPATRVAAGRTSAERGPAISATRPSFPCSGMSPTASRCSGRKEFESLQKSPRDRRCDRY